jgi:hypothetical protein
MNLKLAALLLFSTLPTISQAEVLSSSASGFAVSHTVSTTATPEQSWQAMVQGISQWWHPEHTWSGDAANLYIKAEAGGCFCERLPAGGVEHLRIIYFNPMQEIRFDGSLGPLQTMAVQGHMVWKVDAIETGSSITFTYQVHGFAEGGLGDIASAVDGVIGLQLERLAQTLQHE